MRVRVKWMRVKRTRVGKTTPPKSQSSCKSFKKKLNIWPLFYLNSLPSLLSSLPLLSTLPFSLAMAESKIKNETLLQTVGTLTVFTASAVGQDLAGIHEMANNLANMANMAADNGCTHHTSIHWLRKTGVLTIRIEFQRAGIVNKASAALANYLNAQTAFTRLRNVHDETARRLNNLRAATSARSAAEAAEAALAASVPAALRRSPGVQNLATDAQETSDELARATQTCADAYANKIVAAERLATLKAISDGLQDTLRIVNSMHQRMLETFDDIQKAIAELK